MRHPYVSAQLPCCRLSKERQRRLRKPWRYPFSWAHLSKTDWLHLAETSLVQFVRCGLRVETGHREQRDQLLTWSQSTYGAWETQEWAQKYTGSLGTRTKASFSLVRSLLTEEGRCRVHRGEMHCLVWRGGIHQRWGPGLWIYFWSKSQECLRAMTEQGWGNAYRYFMVLCNSLLLLHKMK